MAYGDDADRNGDQFDDAAFRSLALRDERRSASTYPSDASLSRSAAFCRIGIAGLVGNCNFPRVSALASQSLEVEDGKGAQYA